MATGFYELIGVDTTSTVAQIRSAFGQALQQLVAQRQQREATAASTDDLDLREAQLREAWEVLSDPGRRRRYDAMLRWQASDPRPMDPGPLWADVRDALVHPAAAAAVARLSVVQGLEEPESDETVAVAVLPEPSDRDSSPGDDDGHRSMAVIQLPTAAPAPPNPSLQVVDGSPSSSEVLVLPVGRGAPTEVEVDELPDGLAEEAVAPLVASHGYSGALLRVVREALGLSISQIARRTRISERYLVALEEEAYGSLPATPFVRGYVREVARTLHLDPEAVVAGYLERRARYVPDSR
ncbi:MAG: helix-turn-helix domain-containing protein [Myxococcales bacterium]|nr:helix-turn-helix domain-containing protein [Myxococcales bacterium]